MGNQFCYKKKNLEPPIYEEEKLIPPHYEEVKDEEFPNSYQLMKNELANYFEETDEFLKKLKDNNGLMAGSFPLSVMLKRLGLESFEANDIDIFVEKKDAVHIHSYLETIDYRETGRLKSKSYTGDDIYTVKEYEKYGKIVQVVSTNIKPLGSVRRFDLGCCGTYYDNKGGIVANDPGIFKKHTMLYLGNMKTNSMERIEKYIQRGFKIYYDKIDITWHCKRLIKDDTDMGDFKIFIREYTRLIKVQY